MRRFAAIVLFATAVSAADVQRGVLVENVAARADPAQTYTLYLPRAYDPAVKHPLLFIFDPRSRGTEAAEIFRNAAEEYGWILISSNQTRSDGAAEPNDRAVRALLPEAARYAADPRRLYATGFSGTAILAWGVGVKTGALAGVIGVGGRLVDELPAANFSFAHYGFAGDSDFNNREMRELDERLGAAGKIHRFTQFEGEHRWIDAALARDALAWLEVIAMKEKRRARDEALISRIFGEDLARAEALETESPLAALRRHRAILRTYEGLHPVDAVRAAVERLESDEGVQRERAAESRWDKFEAEFANDLARRMPAIFAKAREWDRPAAADLIRELRIAELRRRASRDGHEGMAARRLLEHIFGQMSFGVPNQLAERGEHRLAAAALTAAAAIHPDRWHVWYSLGRAHARVGDRRRALRALGKAIELGFDDAARLAGDEHYAPIREAADKLLAKSRR